MRLIAGLATLLSVICLATGASAHATLVSTVPADGSVVVQAPKSVQLRFNEAVTPAVVSVIDAAGQTRDDAAVRVAGDTIIITLPDNLPRGTHVVSYRVTSEDGHPVGGSMVFSIGAVTGSRGEPGQGRLRRRFDLAGADRGLSRAVCRRRRSILSMLDRPRARGFEADHRRPGGRSGQRRGGARASGPRLAGSAAGSVLTAAPWKTAAATSLFQSLLVAAAAMAAGIMALRSRVAGIAACCRPSRCSASACRSPQAVMPRRPRRNG